MPPVAEKFLAIVRRDLLTAIRLRRSAIVLLFGLAAELAGLFYLARAVGSDFRPDGMGYYPFLLLGSALYGFLVAAITSFVLAVNEAQTSGTMEVLVTTSTPPALLVTLTAASKLLTQAFHFALYIVFGAVMFGLTFPQANASAAVVVFALSAVMALALGILVATAQLAWRRGMAAVWLLSTAGGLLTGTMFPVSALPAPLQWISSALPLTYAVDAMRLAVVQGAAWADLRVQLLALALFAVTLFPASIAAFEWALTQARRQGTLSYS